MDFTLNFIIHNLTRLKINIIGEKNAINEYQKIMRYTRNMQLRRIFERIILDETTHLEIFKKIEQDIK